jgi:MFS family permease
MTTIRHAETLNAAGREGFLPWLFWSIAALFFCFGFFLRVSPSVMVHDLMRDFAIGGAAVGNLGALYFYSYSAMQLPAGVLHDRFGPRRVLAAAALITGAGCLLFATAPGAGQAGIGRLLIGCGCAFAWLGTCKLIATWFPSNRFALVTGLTVMLGMVGGVSGQRPLALLVDAVGWRATLLGGFAISLALAGLAWLVIRDGGGSGASAASRVTFRDVWIVLRNPQTWTNSVVCAAVSATFLAFGALWGVPYLMAAHGLSKPDAAAMVSLVLIGWGAGAPVHGWISDRISRRKPLIVFGTLVAYGCIITSIYVSGLPLAGATVLLLLFGFAGSTSVLCYTTARESNPSEMAATTIGIVNIAPILLAAAFQPLIGWLLDLRWGGAVLEGARVYSLEAYRFAFLSLVCCGIIGVAVSCLIRETHCRVPPIGTTT